jgi:hypothetical protein
MKVFLTVLTAVSLLAITSVTYAHERGHEKERAGSRHDSNASLRVLFSNGWGPAFGMQQRDQRFRGKSYIKKNWPLWKKVKYMQKMKNKYNKHNWRDRNDRHKNDRRDRHNRRNWYGRYFR